MIQVTRNIAIDESEVHEEFVRASGPGGQNVNKVATAVQLRFDVASSQSLPEEVRQRLIGLAGGQITRDGILIIEARRYRTQRRNRQDAFERLVKLIIEAARKPKIRRKSKPTLKSRMRRLEGKHRRAETKRLRQRVQPADE